jgi:hypothetical protein
MCAAPYCIYGSQMAVTIQTVFNSFLTAFTPVYSSTLVSDVHGLPKYANKYDQ